MAILLEEIRVMKAVRFFDKEKPTSAAKYGFNRSKIRHVLHIATGNLFPWHLDGDFAPHTRILRITDAVGSLRSQHGASAMREETFMSRKEKRLNHLVCIRLDDGLWNTISRNIHQAFCALSAAGCRSKGRTDIADRHSFCAVY